MTGRLAIAGLMVATVAALPGSAQTPADFDDAPNVHVDYYDVGGRDRQAIRAAMLKARPADPNDGERVDALTRWYWRWSWRTASGGCDLPGATLTFSAVVRLPQLDREAVPDPLLANWDAYLAALKRHEAGHVRNGYAGMAEIRAAIAGATCATANAAALAAVARIGARDADFDRRTHHGKDDGAVF